MRTLHWFEMGDGTDLEAIHEVERIVGVEFPADFTEFVIKYAGASNPDECEFVVEELEGRSVIGNFGSVLEMSGDGPDSVLGSLHNLGGQIPKNVVPIIGTGSGDYICLDMRTVETGVVAYFYHGRTGDGAIKPLTHTFSEFLEMLQVPSDT